MERLRVLKRNLSAENNRIVFQNIAGAFLVKGGGLIVSLLTMPAYIRFFDNQSVLGVWFTLLSMLTWILSLDLGIGNGLRNKLVGAIIREDKKEIRELISSTYFMMGIVTTLFLVVGYIIIPNISWNSVLQISKTEISERGLNYVVIIVYTSVILQFFLRTISSVLYALQKSAINNFIYLITSVSILVIVLLTPSADTESNIKVLSIGQLVSVNIPLIVASVIVFKRILVDCSPSIKYVDKKSGLNILVLGWSFFSAQVLYLFIAASNEIIITTLYGPENVVDYQIYYRLFSLLGTLVILALTPFWSVVTKANEENDRKWLNNSLKLMQKIFILVVVCEFLLIFLLRFIVNIWLGDNAIVINYLTAIIFAFYGSMVIYQSIVSTFACGLGRLRIQLIWNSFGIIVKFIAIFIGFRLNLEWNMVVFSTAVAMIPYNIIQSVELKRHFNQRI